MANTLPDLPYASTLTRHTCRVKRSNFTTTNITRLT